MSAEKEAGGRMSRTLSLAYDIDVDCVTLTRYLVSQQKRNPTATGELTQLLNSIQTALKAISGAVRRAGFFDLYGMVGNTNVQGEEVKKLDEMANHFFINMLTSSFTVCAMVSEENENIIFVESEKRGKYIVCFDPLDGSSNIDCLNAIGSIFCIHKKLDPTKKTTKEEDVLQPGSNIIAAGYALYGSATIVVITLGKGYGVHGFTLDPSIGEFILTDSHMHVPKKGCIYSINEGYSFMWPPYVTEYIARKKNPKFGEPFSARYVGSMVADIHRTIKYGGVFMYPSTKKAPTGKLRLLYEANPISFLIEEAGGLAINGTARILDIVPETIHQRTPLYVGSSDDIEEFSEILKSMPSHA